MTHMGGRADRPDNIISTPRRGIIIVVYEISVGTEELHGCTVMVWGSGKG